MCRHDEDQDLECCGECEDGECEEEPMISVSISGTPREFNKLARVMFDRSFDQRFDQVEEEDLSVEDEYEVADFGYEDDFVCPECGEEIDVESPFEDNLYYADEEDFEEEEKLVKPRRLGRSFIEDRKLRESARRNKYAIRRRFVESFSQKEMEEFLDLCQKLNLETALDVQKFSAAHGNVKDQALLAELRKEAEKDVTESVEVKDQESKKEEPAILEGRQEHFKKIIIWYYVKNEDGEEEERAFKMINCVPKQVKQELKRITSDKNVTRAYVSKYVDGQEIAIDRYTYDPEFTPGTPEYKARCEREDKLELAFESLDKKEEAVKLTKDELLDKEGTTDVDLINAGRPEEKRVELEECDLTDREFAEELQKRLALKRKTSK